MYPAGVDAWVNLNVPAQHAVMLSFLTLDVRQFLNNKCDTDLDHIAIKVRARTSGDLNLTVCGHDPPSAEVYHADTVSVRLFTEWGKVRGTGFRLLYSFHSRRQTPEMLANGMWNCSVAVWNSIKDHFPCDLKAQCAGGEDEKGCPYSSPLCAPGEFFFGHSCYSYVKNKLDINWTFASVQCQTRGGHLASLNDMAEWRNVMKMLRQYVVDRAFSGLRTATSSLPQM